jgi:UDP-glucose-4-epimerase GalE
MRLLVTGGAGYIGSFTAERLREAGHEVTVVDDLSAGASSHRDVVVADIRDTETMRHLLRERAIDAVVHLAALKSVADSWRRPDEYHSVNVGGTISLLDAMRDAQVPLLVFSGTCAVYGAPQFLPVTEDHPTDPMSPYGRTKLQAEREIASRAEHGDVRYCTLRYFNAAGAALDGSAGENMTNAAGLVPVVIRTALGLAPSVPVFGTDYPTPDGTAIRDYIHVLDLAEAHLQAVRHLAAGGKSAELNLGTGRGHSVLEVIAMAEHAAGRTIPIRKEARRQGDPPAIWAEASRTRQVLQWKPRLDLQAMLETAWKWHARGLTDAI